MLELRQEFTMAAKGYSARVTIERDSVTGNYNVRVESSSPRRASTAIVYPCGKDYSNALNKYKAHIVEEAGFIAVVSL